MSDLARLLKLTVVGGFVFLIPLAVLVMVLGKAFGIMKVLAQPIDRMFPDVHTVAGFAFVDLLAVLLMVAVCLLAGLASRSKPGRKLNEKVDALLLQVFPGYGWIKGVTGNLADQEAESKLKPAVARLDDQTLVGFEVDRTKDGLVAFYAPGTPDPRSGTLCYMTADRVEPIDASFQAVLSSLKRLGCDSTRLLGRS